MHGVGLCDEWPLVAYPDQYVEGAFDYLLEAGMVLCVEALVSPEGGDFSIKLTHLCVGTECPARTFWVYSRCDVVDCGHANDGWVWRCRADHGGWKTYCNTNSADGGLCCGVADRNCCHRIYQSVVDAAQSA